MAKYQPLPSIALIDELCERGERGQWHDIFMVPKAGWIGLRGCLRAAHCFAFDFPEIHGGDNTAAVAQFTGDCISHGLFRPPFDVTFIQWPGVPGGHWHYEAALILTIVRDGKEMGVLEGMPTSLLEDAKVFASDFAGSQYPRCAAMVFGFAAKATEDSVLRSMAMLQDLSLIRSWESGKKVEITAHKNDPREPWPGEHFTAFNLYHPRLDKQAGPAGRLDAGVTCRAVMYYMGVLSSRGAVSQPMIPDPKVVEKRERQKRSPWVSYSVISLPRESAGSSGVTHGERNSPRQHWRRGHVRRLHSGKLTTVVPCLVGASELGQVIASYQIGKEVLG